MFYPLQTFKTQPDVKPLLNFLHCFHAPCFVRLLLFFCKDKGRKRARYKVTENLPNLENGGGIENGRETQIKGRDTYLLASQTQWGDSHHQDRQTGKSGQSVGENTTRFRCSGSSGVGERPISCSYSRKIQLEVTGPSESARPRSASS